MRIRFSSSKQPKSSNSSDRFIANYLSLFVLTTLFLLRSKAIYKGLFTWRKVVPGRRVTLAPEPSFTERLYEKVVPADRALGFAHDLYVPTWDKNSQSVYMEKIWLTPQGHPTFKASNPPPRVALPLEPTLRCKRFAVWKVLSPGVARYGGRPSYQVKHFSI